MYLQGAKLQGASYGGISPKNYEGLKFWFRASNAVETVLGARITRWLDQSGNENHLTPRSNSGQVQPSGGKIMNTAYGTVVAALTTSDNYLTCVNTEAHKFLFDGSPYTFFIVQRFHDLGSANVIRQIPQSGVNTFTYTLNLNTGGILNFVFATRDNVGNVIYGIIPIPEQTPNSNNILAVTNYGYGNDATPFKVYNNNTLIDSRGYLKPIVPAPSTNAFAYLSTIKQSTYEIIIYDQTGKTKTQIDDERQNIYNNYILKQYPNLL